MLTVTFVLYEKGGMDRTEALRYWRETHGPIAGAIPGLQHYVQQHAVGAPEFAAAIADLPNSADGQRLPTAYVEDVVVVG